MINDTQLSELYPLLYKDGNTNVIPKALSEEDPIYAYLKSFGYFDVSRVKEEDKDNGAVNTKYIAKRVHDVLYFTFKEKEFEPEKHLEFIKFMSKIHSAPLAGYGKTISFTYVTYNTERAWLRGHCILDGRRELPEFDEAGYVDYSTNHILVRMAELRHSLGKYLDKYSTPIYTTPTAVNAYQQFRHNPVYNGTISPHALTPNYHGYVPPTPPAYQTVVPVCDVKSSEHSDENK